MQKPTSELRQDLVSGDWVAIATGRSRRPNEFARKKTVRPPRRKDCPFEKLHEDALVVLSLDGHRPVRSRGTAGGREKENWWVQAVPNKYPAFVHGACGVFDTIGPYRRTNGTGFHEVIITRDHERSFARMSDAEAELVLRAYQDRFLALKKEPCVAYVSIFHNHGPLAGASIFHPHSQLIAVPVVPPDVERSLEGSRAYFHKNNGCVHCAMIGYERKAKERIVYENEHCVALAPFASRTAFELRLYPKKHASRFEDVSASERASTAQALRAALAKLFRGLKNPDHNFFLHTAPAARDGDWKHYHWHWEIIPKTAVWAGFEISTGIEISTISPERAASFLRKIKV